MNNEHNVTLTPTEATLIQFALMYLKMNSPLLNNEFPAIHAGLVTKTGKVIWEAHHGE